MIDALQVITPINDRSSTRYYAYKQQWLHKFLMTVALQVLHLLMTVAL